MVTLFSQEYAAEMWEHEIRTNALKQGRQEGLYEGRREGLSEGRQNGLSIAIRNLQATTGLPLEQVMDMLRIPEAERPAYRKLLLNP